MTTGIHAGSEIFFSQFCERCNSTLFFCMTCRPHIYKCVNTGNAVKPDINISGSIFKKQNWRQKWNRNENYDSASGVRTLKKMCILTCINSSNSGYQALLVCVCVFLSQPFIHRKQFFRKTVRLAFSRVYQKQNILLARPLISSLLITCLEGD